VVTPEGAILEAEATSVVFPAHDGEYGVLPGHAPLLSLVGVGELRVNVAGGAQERYYVESGFAQVTGGEVVLLTEKAWPLSALSVREAEKLLEQARNMTVTGEDERAQREATYWRGHVQRRLARKVVESSGL
jgi:F-type H+-transporting ATPase subunit epsilon